MLAFSSLVITKRSSKVFQCHHQLLGDCVDTYIWYFLFWWILFLQGRYYMLADLGMTYTFLSHMASICQHSDLVYTHLTKWFPETELWANTYEAHIFLLLSHIYSELKNFVLETLQCALCVDPGFIVVRVDPQDMQFWFPTLSLYVPIGHSVQFFP